MRNNLVQIGRRARHIAGVLALDLPRFSARLAMSALPRWTGAWLGIRNRREAISTDRDGIVKDYHWRFTSDLNVPSVLPAAGRWLLRRAVSDRPIMFFDGPPATSSKATVTFAIGHRGMERLPLLLATISTIAAQEDVSVRCIVVEQSPTIQIRDHLPAWVDYIHTVTAPDLPYCRSWAFNVAARASTADVLIFHDNDLLVPTPYASEAERLLKSGVGFADMKRFLFYLDARDTETLITRRTVAAVTPERIVQNAQGGSIVARRSPFEAIGGFDESFIGWGGEDNEFWERAVSTGIATIHGVLPMVHLHHRSQPGKDDRSSAAIVRHEQLMAMDPRERIARLVSRRWGSLDGPSRDEA